MSLGSSKLSSNPSIERTSQRPLRALWPAAHVERWAPVGEAACTRCTPAEAGVVRFASARKFASPLLVARSHVSRRSQPGCPSAGGPLTVSFSPRK